MAFLGRIRTFFLFAYNGTVLAATPHERIGNHTANGTDMPLSASIEVGTVCPDGGRIDLNILIQKDKSGAVELRFSGPGDRPEDRASLILTADEFDALRSLILRVEREKERLVMRDTMRSWIYNTNQRDLLRREVGDSVDMLPDITLSGDGGGDGTGRLVAA
jgi:hypothetical protein